MAKIQTGEFSSYTNDLLDALAQSKVYLWDCGPEEPRLPEPPEEPSGRGGDPKYDLERLKYKRALKHYEDELLTFENRDKEFRHWHFAVKGPVEIMMWSVDARDALANDSKAVADGRQKKPRYFVSSRTRGWEKTKNLGLPPGVVPGPGHKENLDRQIAGDQKFVEALKADPQFGQEVT
jgi:hypothetical protein